MRKKLAQLKKADLPLVKWYEQFNSVLKSPCDYTKLSFNKSAFNQLEKMKQTAANYKIVYLASNQVFSRDSMFVIKKDFKDHRWIDEAYTNPQSYRGYINPEIEQKLGQVSDVWERCMSIPYIQCRIKRHTQLKVSYVNEKREKINEQIIGFKAYVYQHCIDHLKGKCVLDWNQCRGFMRVYTEAEDLFPKTRLVLRDYSLRIKEAIAKRKNPEQDIVLTDDLKQYQAKEQQVLRKSLQEQIQKLTERYGK